MDLATNPVEPEVSIILPCLNEEQSVGQTVTEAYQGLAAAGLSGEVLVVDNGSTDQSVSIANEAGAQVFYEAARGYGAAIRCGIEHASGRVGVMADADLTYDLPNVGRLVGQLEQGHDLVLACRLSGINAGTMPILHRMVGTPALTALVRLLTGSRLGVRDSQSGFRAFDLERIRALQLRSDGMEFASEMLVQAAAHGYRVGEIDLEYRERVGDSKLETLRDGLRHLKLLAVLAPQMLVLAPAIVLGLIGLLLTFLTFASPDGIEVGTARWQPIFLAPIALVLSVMLGALFPLLQLNSPIRPSPASSADHHRLQRRLAVVGGLFILVGALLDGALFVAWIEGASSSSSRLALAGLAQALLLSGALCWLVAFLYRLLRGQVRYARRGLQRESVATL